jgi:hypothetical protein
MNYLFQRRNYTACYLGVIFTNDGRIDKEINNRIKKANQIYYEINNALLGKKEVEPKT